jgi:putative FmdB family regulatory protein
MPIYEFQCKKCDKVVEKKMSYDERLNPQKCEECGEDTERIASLPLPPIFNGSGWTPKFGK